MTPPRKSPSPNRRPAYLNNNALMRLSGTNLARLRATNRTARNVINANPRLLNKIARNRHKAMMTRVHRQIANARRHFFCLPGQTCHARLYPNTVPARYIHGLRRTGRVITPERRRPNLNNFNNLY